MTTKAAFALKQDVNAVELNVQHLDETVRIDSDAPFVTDDPLLLRTLEAHEGLKPVPVPYDALTVDELKELAGDRKIAVKRADGKEGEPLKADYLAALAAADKKAAASEGGES